MKKHIISLALFLSFLFASQLHALPRFALLRGEGNCLGWHVNPIGGQIRSAGGETFAINDLAMWKRGDSTTFTGQIAKGLRLGGDFRSQALYFSQTKSLFSTEVVRGDSGKRSDTTRNRRDT